MADANVYFDASYGGVSMLIASISTDRGRDITVQSPSRGDKHALIDRGRKLIAADAEILFVDQQGLDPYTTRYENFRNLAEGIDAQIFSHPLDGSYVARISDLRVRAEAGTGEITVTCNIFAEDEPQTTFPIGAGTSPAAGVDAVSTAQLNADTQLMSLGLSSTATAPCTAAVTAWSTADILDSQTVFTAVGALTQQIAESIADLDLAVDLAKWVAYQAMINLAYQVVRAGEAFTATSGQLFQITVGRALPLLAICAPIYGADLASDFADQVAAINRIRTPGLVPAGTILKMPPVQP